MSGKTGDALLSAFQLHDRILAGGAGPSGLQCSTPADWLSPGEHFRVETVQRGGHVQIQGTVTLKTNIRDDSFYSILYLILNPDGPIQLRLQIRIDDFRKLQNKRNISNQAQSEKLSFETLKFYTYTTRVIRIDKLQMTNPKTIDSSSIHI